MHMSVILCIYVGLSTYLHTISRSASFPAKVKSVPRLCIWALRSVSKDWRLHILSVLTWLIVEEREEQRRRWWWGWWCGRTMPWAYIYTFTCSTCCCCALLSWSRWRTWSCFVYIMLILLRPVHHYHHHLHLPSSSLTHSPEWQHQYLIEYQIHLVSHLHFLTHIYHSFFRLPCSATSFLLQVKRGDDGHMGTFLFFSCG